MESPSMQPDAASYLGSQTLIERDGTYYIEHRNAADDLDRTETVGNLLDLNFRLLGLK